MCTVFGPLSSPEPSVELTATEAAAFPAVRLFVERVSAIAEDFVLTDANAALVGAICRRLDGLPLAIEFAAPRIEVLGVEGLAARLDDSLRRLSGARRRAAIPRHQTMRAVIDWSYGLLSDDEQRLFRALGIFAGGFTREAAAAVAMDAATDDADAIDRLVDLVAKSLVAADVTGTTPRFRLLDTTRAYAAEKLAESGEATRTARRHAEFYLALFAAVRSQGAIENLSRHLLEVDNLRAALNWAFSAGGDAFLGTELAAESIDFWGAASLLGECCEWAEKALAEIGAAAGTRREMVLRCGLGTALIYSRGQSSLAREALTAGLALARKFEDFDYQQRAAFGLWQFVGRTESLHDAVTIGRQYEAIAGDRDLQFRATADWMIGLPLCYLPDHVEAGERLQRAVDRYPVDRRARDMIRLGADLRASAFCHLAVNLSLRGLLDAACETAIRAIEEARATKHPVALCISLLWTGCVVSLNLGELDTAGRCRDELLDVAQKHGLRPFHAAGLCISGSLRARGSDPREGVGPLRAGLAELLETRYLTPHPFFQAKLAAILAAIGSAAEGVIEIDDALRRTIEMDNGWIVPELLRVKGEMLLRHGAEETSVIADLFGQSLKQAREQQALYWELCSATSLTRLLRDQGRPADAYACLQPVYDRFTEGFGTADLIAAKQLLDDLGASGHR
jgi:non-specific serine/threonine protein kinase